MKIKSTTIAPMEAASFMVMRVIEPRCKRFVFVNKVSKYSLQTSTRWGRAIHNGSHFEYDRLIQRYLDAIPTNVTPNQAYNEVVKIIDKVKTAIKNNPNTPINQLIF